MFEEHTGRRQFGDRPPDSAELLLLLLPESDYEPIVARLVRTRDCRDVVVVGAAALAFSATMTACVKF